MYVCVCLLVTKFINFAEKKARAMKFGRKVECKLSHRSANFQYFGAHMRQVTRRQKTPILDFDPFNRCNCFLWKPTALKFLNYVEEALSYLIYTF